MAEDHMKYMPHHPKPKHGGNGGVMPTKDTMLRQRSELTGHIPGNAGQDAQYPEGGPIGMPTPPPNM